MQSIFSGRIQDFKSIHIDPLFPGVAFRCRWLDNVRAYRSSNLSERHFLEFAAHDLVQTARNTTKTDSNDLVGADLRKRLIANLPQNQTSVDVADHFMSALRERCYEDVPGMKFLGDDADGGMLLDVHRRYGATNIYGATDPTIDELNQAAIHFTTVLQDYVRKYSLSDDLDNLANILKTTEKASATFAEFCSPIITREINARADALREIHRASELSPLAL